MSWHHKMVRLVNILSMLLHSSRLQTTVVMLMNLVLSYSDLGTLKRVMLGNVACIVLVLWTSLNMRAST